MRQADKAGNPPTLLARTAALRPLRLPPRDKMVLFWLMYHAGKSWPKCWPSVETLAAETCMSAASVKAATGALVRRGLLKKQRRKDTSSEYTVLLPVPVGPDSGRTDSGLTQVRNLAIEPRRVEPRRGSIYGKELEEYDVDL